MILTPQAPPVPPPGRSQPVTPPPGPGTPFMAMRVPPQLKRKHESLRAAGTPARGASVALMRKLLETANAPVKADRVRTPKPA